MGSPPEFFQPCTRERALQSGNSAGVRSYVDVALQTRNGISRAPRRLRKARRLDSRRMAFQWTWLICASPACPGQWKVRWIEHGFQYASARISSLGLSLPADVIRLD